MRHYRIANLDPAENLAFEEALLRKWPLENGPLLTLWRNSRSVIIGRHQLAHAEVDMDQIRYRQMPVIRRISGGGAVYHDFGNLNFSFILPGVAQPLATLMQPILETLGKFGVEASLNGRNDLLAGGFKISGCSEFRAGSRRLVHGTLLVNADFDMMETLLTPDKLKMNRHGVKSVKARVRNISELWRKDSKLEDLINALIHRIAPDQGAIPQDIFDRASQLAKDKYRSELWNFKKPVRGSYSQRKRFSWGMLEINFDVANNSYVRCKIFGDFISLQEMKKLEKTLDGFRPELALRLGNLNLADFFLGCNHEETANFIVSSLESADQ